MEFTSRRAQYRLPGPGFFRVCLFIITLAFAINAILLLSISEPVRIPTITAVGKYVSIIDAGSSGTRLHVYFIPDTPNPDIIHVGMHKVEPGLSSYTANKKDVLHGVKELLNFADRVIPDSQRKDTEFFVFATAGLRLLSDDDSSELLGVVTDFLVENDVNIGRVSDDRRSDNVKIISGKTEGVFSWLSLNYLLENLRIENKFLTLTTTEDSAGLIEMGGASMQICYEIPSDMDVDEQDTVTLPATRLVETNIRSEGDVRLYVSSMLGLGANSALDRYQSMLFASEWQTRGVDADGEGVFEIYDPCMLWGYEESRAFPDGYDSVYSSVAVLGLGDFAQCVQNIRRYDLLVDVRYKCEDGFELDCERARPPLSDVTTMKFWGASEFFHTFRDLYKYAQYAKETLSLDVSLGAAAVTDPKIDLEMSHIAYDTEEVAELAKYFCSMYFAQLMDSPIYTEHFRKQCFKVGWALVVLTDGYGAAGVEQSASVRSLSRFRTADRNGAKKGLMFTSAGVIKEETLSWTLGAAMLYAMDTLDDVE